VSLPRPRAGKKNKLKIKPMIGDPEQFGKPISEQLSEYLKEYTTTNDRADVCEQTSIGTSTLRDVVFRYNSLSKTNYIAVVELMRVAVRNCTQRIQSSKQAKRFFESELSQIEVEA
jgi:hypothetical protein